MKIKDIVPNGTSFVEGSMKVYKNDGVSDWDNNDGVFIGVYNKITKTVEWNCTNLLPSAKGVVVFKVKVEKEAVGAIVDNVANYELGLNKYNSNHVKTSVKQNKASAIGNDKNVLKPSGEITYYVGYRNTENVAQDITITDVIPTNTKYITGSATNGVDETGIIGGVGTLKWVINNVAPNESGYVTFKVRVDDNAADGVQIENEADITIGTNSPYITNKTIDIVNPKTSSITHYNPAHTSNYVYTNDKLTYEIKYINNTLNSQDITVSDTIPFGTILESMPAGATGYDKNNAVTVVLKDVVRLEWTFSNVAPNTVGSVTFDVTVTAKEGSVLNLGHVKIGDRNPIVTNEVINKFEPKKPNFTTPDKYLVTFLDCQGNTVKVEWIKPNTSATPPTGYGVYEGYINVSSHRDLKPTGCGIKFNKGYKIPKTGQTDNDLIWYITLGMGCVLLGLIKKEIY